MEQVNILLVDDHQIIVDGIRSLIDGHERFNVIGEAHNGQEALDFLELLSPRLVLLDIDMPRMNGIEATRQIKSRFPEVKVIILSMHHESGLIKTIVQAGADGYILKNSDRQELLAAIGKVAEGEKYFSSDVTLSLLNKPASGLKQFREVDKKADLTSREIEVLKLIAEGLSNKEIGEKLFISHRTVDTHRTNLMKKLDVNNIAGLVRYAIQHGFVA